MSTGEAIKAARRAAGLTQAELAKRLGVTPQTVSQYERGIINPKLETLQKFANALGTDVWNLSDPLFIGQPGTPCLVLGENASEEEREQYRRWTESKAAMLTLLKLEREQEQKRLDQIINDFYLLTDEGQEKAAERVHELTEVPKYQNVNAIALEQYKAEHTAPDTAGTEPDDTDTDTSAEE